MSAGYFSTTTSSYRDDETFFKKNFYKDFIYLRERNHTQAEGGGEEGKGEVGSWLEPSEQGA